MDLSGYGFIDAGRQREACHGSETFLSTASSRMAVALVVPLDDSLMVGGDHPGPTLRLDPQHACRRVACRARVAMLPLPIPTVKREAVAERKERLGLPRGSEHLLLVDDEPVLLDVGRPLLEKLGYRISTAEGSEQALEMFGQAPQAYDLVLTDRTMPKMTGDRLAAAMLKTRPDLPVILTKGYSMKITARDVGSCFPVQQSFFPG